jgi:hypothetical protein
VFVHIALWVSIFFLIIINFPLLWILVGVFSLIFFVYLLSFQKLRDRGAQGSTEIATEVNAAKNPTKKVSQVSPYALIVLGIALIFTVVSKLPVV